MPFPQLKLFPVLLCLTVVGLTAAFLPYPGLDTGSVVVLDDSVK